MEKIKYRIIKTKKEYIKYCNILENLVLHDNTSDEIELLELLIKNWDDAHNSLNNLRPVEIIKYLMAENNLKSKDLAEILNLSKGTVSKILNYRKGLSKDTIRKLSDYFKISQEAFNKPYKLINDINRKFKKSSLMNTKKNIKILSVV